jgi:Uma2 family endonuclease
MATLVTDPFLESQLKEGREPYGGDRYDEVWEGVRFLAPLPNNEHQDIQGDFVALLKTVVGWDSGARVCAGVNVSDREEGWQFNYRCPDVVVFLPGNRAKNCGTHWVGGPDFLIEITSAYDRSSEKLPFYSSVGAREVLMIEREPSWKLTLHGRADGNDKAPLKPIESCTEEGGEVLRSRVLPLTFRLTRESPRPRIEVTLVPEPAGTAQRWLI